MSWQSRKEKRGGQSGFSQDAQFAKVTLSEAHKQDFLDWYGRVIDDLELVLTDFCNSGYRISIRYDLNNRSFLSSVTQQFDDHVHGKTIVTSRGRSALECLVMGLYKVLELYPDEPFPTDSPYNDWG